MGTKRKIMFDQSIFEALMAGNAIQGPFSRSCKWAKLPATLHRSRDMLVFIAAALAVIVVLAVL
jgi:hypothetical protein